MTCVVFVITQHSTQNTDPTGCAPVNPTTQLFADTLYSPNHPFMHTRRRHSTSTSQSRAYVGPLHSSLLRHGKPLPAKAAAAPYETVRPTPQLQQHSLDGLSSRWSPAPHRAHMPPCSGVVPRQPPCAAPGSRLCWCNQTCCYARRWRRLCWQTPHTRCRLLLCGCLHMCHAGLGVWLWVGAVSGILVAVGGAVAGSWGRGLGGRICGRG